MKENSYLDYESLDHTLSYDSEDKLLEFETDENGKKIFENLVSSPKLPDKAWKLDSDYAKNWSKTGELDYVVYNIEKNNFIQNKEPSRNGLPISDYSFKQAFEKTYSARMQAGNHLKNRIYNRIFTTAVIIGFVVVLFIGFHVVF